MYVQSSGKSSFAEAHLDLGVTPIETGKSLKAQKHFRAALEHRATRPQGLITLGRACRSQGWTNEALASFTEAVRLDPADARAQCGLGDMLVVTGRFAEAQRLYSEAVRLKPEFAEAHLGLGIALLNQRRSQEALGHFQETLRLNPTNAAAQKYLNAIQAEPSGTHAWIPRAVSPWPPCIRGARSV